LHLVIDLGTGPLSGLCMRLRQENDLVAPGHGLLVFIVGEDLDRRRRGAGKCIRYVAAGEVVVGEIEEEERGGGHDVFGDSTTAPPDAPSDGGWDCVGESVVEEVDVVEVTEES
jgi:hypothetical protein